MFISKDLFWSSLEIIHHVVNVSALTSVAITDAELLLGLILVISTWDHSILRWSSAEVLALFWSIRYSASSLATQHGAISQLLWWSNLWLSPFMWWIDLTEFHFIFLFLFAHFLCLKYLIALRTSLFIFLCFALKPLLQTVRMEEMLASWDTSDGLVLQEGVDANDAITYFREFELAWIFWIM